MPLATDVRERTITDAPDTAGLDPECAPYPRTGCRRVARELLRRLSPVWLLPFIAEPTVTALHKWFSACVFTLRCDVRTPLQALSHDPQIALALHHPLVTIPLVACVALLLPLIWIARRDKLREQTCVGTGTLRAEIGELNSWRAEFDSWRAARKNGAPDIEPHESPIDLQNDDAGRAT